MNDQPYYYIEEWTVEQLIAALKTLPADMKFAVRLEKPAAKKYRKAHA